ELGEARDIVNRGRQWSNFAGSRSAFMNLVPTRDAFDFLVNYFYAVLRLNLPILFNPAPQEVFLMLNVGIYGWLAYIGCSVRDPAVRFPVVLFISHVLVLTIFEPDLGSYLRHLSSVFIYLLPALSFWDWQRMPQHRPRRL